MIESTATPAPYTPRRPTLAALGLMFLWVFILSLPMWTGQYMAGPLSDQYSTGWAVRHWGAEQWRTTGHLPLWNPEMVVGVPVVAGFGDLFYPTAWLRLVLPTTISIDLAFVVHYVLAGLFLYLLLRMLSISWLGSVVGGTAYQLSGVIVSYASPGHDGKLFVTTLFPLMLIGLVLGIRRRRLEGYALLGIAVGLALLSPQYQTTQYALLASGIFALYLTLGEPAGLTPRQQWSSLGLASIGVGLGFGVAMLQVLPFMHYVPFSPRAGPASYDWATSYATPWIHVPEFFLSGFTGSGYTGALGGTYWGPNGLKLHSEYLGLPVIALAILGVGAPKRRLVQWIVGILVLFLLISLGDGTPFYRLWWSLVPYVNKTRAPGIAFYMVGFATAVLAALGAERLERGEGKTWVVGGMIAGGLVVLLATVGTFGSIASSYALSHQEALRLPLVQAATAAQSGILWGALGSGVGLIAVAGVAFLYLRGKVTPPIFAVAVVILVGADLWRAGQGFWHWSRPETEQLGSDDVIRHLTATPLPYRVYDLDPVYPHDALMAYNIPQVTGYHGFALQAYNNLVGGESEQENLHRSLNLWKLLAVRFFIYHDTLRAPGFHRALGPARTAMGRQVYLYEADSIPPYVRVVPAGVKADTAQIVPTLMDPRLDYSRIVLFAPDQPVNPAPITEMPAPSASHASIAHWAPGRMTITLAPPPTDPSYLLVSENWYKDWRATVNGDTATVLRGDESLITVPIRAGARTVELAFEPQDYQTGKHITWASLFLLVAMAGAPTVLRRRDQGRGQGTRGARG